VELLVLADDLTGALDATVGFRPRPVVVVPAPPPDEPRTGAAGTDLERRLSLAAAAADVVGVDTGSRDLDVDDAVRRVRRVLAWTRSQAGPTRLVKKVDSALRGHVRAELEAVAGSEGPPVLLCPALPEHGRTTVGGQHRDARPGSGQQPVLTDLRSLVPSGYRAVPVDATSLRGPELSRQLRALRRGELGLVDAASESDLCAVAASLPQAPGLLVAASSGLLRAMGRSEGGGVVPPDEVTRPRLVVMATRHAAARGQVERLLSGLDLTRLVELDVDARSGRAPSYAAAVQQLCAAGPVDVLVLTVARLPSSPEPAAARTVGLAIASALAEVTARFLAASPDDELLLIGGDLAAAVCRRLQVELLIPVGEPAPGTVLCRAVPAVVGAEVPLMSLRSGGFGPADALLTLLGARSPRPQGGRVV